MQVTVYCLIGFPGETAEEAWETADFLFSDDELMRSRGLHISLWNFSLPRGSRVASSPGDYGVEVLGPQGDASLSMRFRTQKGMGVEETAQVWREIREAVRDRVRGEALPHPTSHSLLYLDRASSREAPPAKLRQYRFSGLLDARPALAHGIPTLKVGEVTTAYDPTSATSRSLGRCGSRAIELCDGQRSGSDVCVELKAAGFAPGEVLVTLAQLLRAGILTV